MINICVSRFERLQRIPFAKQLGAETTRPMRSNRRANRLSHGFKLLALFLLGILFAAAPARANGGFPIRYTGTLTHLGTGSVTGPLGVAAALDGTLYIADTGGNRIVKVTPAGAASVFSITGTTALNAPHQLTVDSSGNLYIADTGNSRIVKVDTSGSGAVVNTQSITLSAPQAVAVDTSGNIFISDTGHNQIVKVTAGGTASVLSTSSGVSLGTLSSPKGIATDIFGNLYIVDSGNNRVVKVTTALVGSALSTSGTLNGPVAVTVGNNGNIYIVDGPANQRVAVVSPSGDLYDLLFDQVNTEFGTPSAIAVTANGTFYIADSANNNVNAIQVDVAGFGHVTLGNSGTPQTLNFVVNGTSTVTGVAIYTAGTPNLDFTIAANSGTPCTTGSNGISCTVNVQFTPTSAGLRRGALVLSYSDTSLGTSSLTVPLFGYGDAPVAALSPAVGSVVSVGSVSVTQPFQTAYDGVGNIYVTSYQNSKVLKIPAGGGSGSQVTIPALPSPSTLNSPTGLAIDGAGNLFISDYNNSRLVEVTAAGTSKVVAVRGLSGGFSFPTALAFDPAGRLYVSDYGHGRIILLSPDIYHNNSNDGDGTVGISVAYIYPLGSYTLGSDNSTGVAVDLTGNVYFTDQNQDRILKADPLGNVSVVSLPSVTLNAPLGVALDPSGNLYIADSGNQRLILKTAAGDVSVMKYSGPSLGQFVFGIAPDNSSNVLVSDFINNRLVLLNVGQSSLTFPSTQAGSKSTTKTTTVTNLGDQALVFSANPTYTVNFSQDTTDVNPCTSDTSLATGQSCDVPIIFSPQSVGSLSTNITLTDNTQNIGGSTQQIAVSGTSTNPAVATTTTVTASLASPVYGQSLTLTATVSTLVTGSPAVSTPVSTPTGTVTFTDLTTSTTLASNVTLVSGVATVTLSTLTTGSHSIRAVYTPTGNFLTSNGTKAVTIAKAGTATALTLSGSTLTATVTVVAPGAGTLSGTVQFLNGSTVLGTATLSGGTAALTTTVPSTYSFTAVYSGDTNFTSSTSAPLSNTAVPTTTTVTVSPSSSTYGQLLTFTATVSPAVVTAASTVAISVGTPTGTVTFTDQTTSTVLASNVSLGSGVASVAVSTLGAGGHTIQAVYTPTGIFLTSSGSVTATISKAATSTSLSLSGGTLTAVVAVLAPGAGTPSGTVQFLNNGIAVGTATLTGGTATLALTGTPSSLTAVYSGDANFTASTSPAVNQPANSSLSLTSFSPNPSALGQAVTFTAVVSTSGGPPSAAAAGSVQFSDGGKVLGTASLISGQAVFTTSTLSGGAHNIVAQYSGDNTFPPAQANYRQLVTAPVTMTLSAAPVVTVFGQAIVLTASVSGTPPAGFSAPTGQVNWAEVTSGTSFGSPAMPLGTVPLSSGMAVLSLNTLGAGNHTIAALYSGDATWENAVRTVIVTVSKASSTSAVSLAIVAGQLTLSANVAAVAPAAGTPTGAVQFVDTKNSAVIATASLSGGKASAAVAASAAAGVEGRPIAAVYAGDANFNGSASPPLPAVVNAASNSSGVFAADEIASLFGITGLTGDTTAAPPLTTSLGGVTITITDSSGAVQQALIYGVYASSGQINFLVPAGAAAGPAKVDIALPGGGTITTVVNIGSTAPGIFTSDMTGNGAYSGQVVYVHKDGSQTVAGSADPISLGQAGDQVFLVLYGTGFRHATSVTAMVNGTSLPVAYVGAQGTYDGLDQVNVGPLPASLAGAGTVTIVITAGGQQANTVTFNVQ